MYLYPSIKTLILLADRNSSVFSGMEKDLSGWFKVYAEFHTHFPFDLISFYWCSNCFGFISILYLSMYELAPESSPRDPIVNGNNDGGITDTFQEICVNT